MKTSAKATKKTPKKKTKKAKKKIMKKIMKKINCQTNDENITIVNVIDEDFDMHRIFEIIDEKKDEDFTVDNAAEKEVDKTTVIDDEADEAIGKKEVNRADETGEANHEYLTKTSLTAFSIITFNLSNCLNVKSEIIEIKIKVLLKVLQNCCKNARCDLILLKNRLKILN